MRAWIALLACVFSSSAFAAHLPAISMSVVDRDGKPVPGVAVHVDSLSRQLGLCKLNWDGPGRYPCIKYDGHGEQMVETDQNGKAALKPIHLILGSRAEVIVRVETYLGCEKSSSGYLGEQVLDDSELLGDGCILDLKGPQAINSLASPKLECRLAITAEEFAQRLQRIRADWDTCAWQRVF